MINVDASVTGLSRMGIWELINYMESLGPARRQMILQVLKGGIQ